MAEEDARVESGESEDEESESELLKSMYSAKMRFRLGELANERLKGEDDEEADDDDDDEEGGEDAAEQDEEDEDQTPLPGPFADLVPVNGGKCMRCAYCKKNLLNERDIVEHVRSKSHRKKYRKAKLARLPAEKAEAIKKKAQERKKAKRTAKLLPQREAKIERAKAKKRRRVESLTPEQIQARKEKFQRKKARKEARKAAAAKSS